MTAAKSTKREGKIRKTSREFKARKKNNRTKKRNRGQNCQRRQCQTTGGFVDLTQREQTSKTKARNERPQRRWTFLNFKVILGGLRRDHPRNPPQEAEREGEKSGKEGRCKPGPRNEKLIKNRTFSIQPALIRPGQEGAKP